ncbi:MAG: hypothetical protein R3C11_14860 [Planctomycetaceae bacterium]
MHTEITSPSQTEIPIEEVEFATSASPLHTARLFSWKGELYRAIPEAGLPRWQQLHDSGLLQELIDQKWFVETTATDYRLDGAALVLKHRRIPFPHLSVRVEFSSTKVCHDSLLDLNIRLSRGKGLATTDVHPWNLVFDGTNPCSSTWFVRPAGTDSPGRFIFNQFRTQFWYPLQLMAKGQGRLARSPMQESSSRSRKDELPGYHYLWRRCWLKLAKRCGHTRIGRVAQKLARLNRFHLQRQPATPSWIKELERWKRRVERLRFPNQKTFWSHYYADDFPDHQQPASWSLKQRTVAEVLQELKPATLHDLAGNSGWYSLLAQQLGAKVICSDNDDLALNQLFERQSHDPSISLAFLNLVNPIGPHGTIDAHGKRLYTSVDDRLQAECLLALGLTHHLVFTEMFDFHFIFGLLSQFTKQNLIVEFVSREDDYVKTWWNESYSWYSLEEFCRIAREYFENVEVRDSSPAGRFLVVCNQKRNR